MKKKRKLYKKIWIWILVAIAILVGSTAGWYLRSPIYPFLINLPPERAIGFFRAVIDSDSEAEEFLQQAAQAKLVDADSKFIRKTAVRAAVSAAIPVRIYGWLVPGRTDDNPDYVVFFDVGKRIRLVKLVHRLVLSNRLFSSNLKKISSFQYPIFTQESVRCSQYTALPKRLTCP